MLEGVLKASGFWYSVFIVILLAASPAFAEESCDCASLKCQSCEIQTGTTFYTAKCGVHDSRVKSCQRPTCTPVQNQAQCLNPSSKPGPKAEIASEEPQRETPSVALEAGQILDVSGDVEVVHASGVKEKPVKRETTYVGDVFQTKAFGRLKVVLRDGSEMSLAGDSRLKIEKVDVDPVALKRQIALRILSGRVRNKVEKDYKGDNYFQVRTRTAVAGVRGTDFITSYLLKEGQMISEVRTLKGLVHLQAAAPIAADQAASEIDIPAGTFAALATEPVNDSDSEDAVRAAVSKAHLSPLFKIKDDEQQRLKVEEFLPRDEASSAPVNRTVASSDDAVLCKQPEGRFNQCSYSCMNNPKGESKCRTDLSKVTCVRRLCRANGKWEESVRLPTKEGVRCSGAGSVVGSCDAYWF